MNLKEHKLDEIEKEIISTYLKAGYAPNSNEVTNAISQKLAESKLDEPIYKYVHDKTQMDSDDYRDAIKDICIDCNILYNSIKDLYDMAIMVDNEISLMKQSIDSEMQILEKKLTKLTLSTEDNEQVIDYRDILEEHADQSQTTANIVDRKITLPSLINRSILDYSISYKNYLDSKLVFYSVESSDIRDLTNNIPWKYTSYLYQESAGKWLEFTIQFKQPMSFVHFTLDLVMMKPCRIDIFAICNQNRILISENQNIMDSVSCSLPNDTTSIVFAVYKPEIDKKYVQDTIYRLENNFIIKSIRLAKYNYATEALYVSNKLSFDKNIDGVYIDVDQVLPNGTSTTYSLSLDGTTWHTIDTENKEMFYTRSMEKDNQLILSLPKDLTLESQKLYDGSTIDENIYSLRAVNKTEIASNIRNYRMYRGGKCFAVYRIPKDSRFDFSDNDLLLFTSIGQDGMLHLDTDKNYKYKLVTYIENKGYAEYLTFSDNDMYPIYDYKLNKQSIPFITTNGKHQYQCGILHGSNIFEIFITDQHGEQIIKTGIDFPSLPITMRYLADPQPMRLLELDILRHTEQETYNGFSVITTDEKIIFCGKCPSGFTPKDMQYYLYYDYILSECKDLYLKAKLSTTIPSITPIINNIQIKVV